MKHMFMKTTFFIVTLILILVKASYAQVVRNENLFRLYIREVVQAGLSQRQVQGDSLKEISHLVNSATHSIDRQNGISLQQAEKIYRMILNHPVVSPHMEPLYDPEDKVGFCFGRAMFVHLELLARGVNRNDIRKAFVVGPLFAEDISWSFHVATAVKGVNGKWWVIDSPPFGEGVVDLEAWYKHQLTFSKDGKLRLFMTNPQQFTPTDLKYNRETLLSDSYRKYFDHMLYDYKVRYDQISKFSTTMACEKLF